jgi:hypothetical protein
MSACTEIGFGLAEGFALVADGAVLGVRRAGGVAEGVGDAAEVAAADGLLPTGVEGALVPPGPAVQPVSSRPAMTNPPRPVRRIMS